MSDTLTNIGGAASPHVGPAVSHVPDGCPPQNTTPGSGVTRTGQRLGGQRGEGLAPRRPKNLGGQTSVWTQASDVQLCKETSSILKAESRGCGARPCATLWGGTTPVPSWRGHPEPTPAWRLLPVSLAPAQKEDKRRRCNHLEL